MDAALSDAAHLGVTVVAAAGDDLSTERMGDNRAHVDYHSRGLSSRFSGLSRSDFVVCWTCSVAWR